MTQLNITPFVSFRFWGCIFPTDVVTQFMHLAADWGTRLGCPINYAYVSNQGKPKSKGVYSRVKRRIAEMKLVDMDGLSLMSFPLAPQHMVYDQIMGFDLDFRYKHTCTFSVPSERLPLSDPLSLNLADGILNLFKPEYGLMTELPKCVVPGWYLSGMGVVNSGSQTSRAFPDEEAGDFQRGETGRVWEVGLLRQVYQRNWLNRQHLEQQIDGLPLRQWIEAGNGMRGELAITPGRRLACWSVPDAELFSLRHYLSAAGLVFNEVRHHDIVVKQWETPPRRSEPID